MGIALVSIAEPLNAFSCSSLVGPVWRLLLFDLIEEVLERQNKLTLCIGIIARWILAKVCQDRDKIHIISPKFLRMAHNLVFMLESRKIDVVVRTTENLVGLHPF